MHRHTWFNYIKTLAQLNKTVAKSRGNPKRFIGKMYGRKYQQKILHLNSFYNSVRGNLVLRVFPLSLPEDAKMRDPGKGTAAVRGSLRYQVVTPGTDW